MTFGLLNLGLADIEADDLFKGRSQDEAALAFKSNFIKIKTFKKLGRFADKNIMFCFMKGGSFFTFMVEFRFGFQLSS